jgi:acid stress-induced BolA-like protein IbaG/YrbA
MQWQATLIENVQNRLNIIMRNTFAKDGNAQQVIQVKTRMENQRSYRKQNSQAIVDVKLVRIIRRIHALSIEC